MLYFGGETNIASARSHEIRGLINSSLLFCSPPCVSMDDRYYVFGWFSSSGSVCPLTVYSGISSGFAGSK